MAEFHVECLEWFHSSCRTLYNTNTLRHKEETWNFRLDSADMTSGDVVVWHCGNVDGFGAFIVSSECDSFSLAIPFCGTHPFCHLNATLTFHPFMVIGLTKVGQLLFMCLLLAFEWNPPLRASNMFNSDVGVRSVV